MKNLVFFAILSGSLLLVACGRSEETDSKKGDEPAATSLTLTSAAFSDGSRIPDRHTCSGEDFSPPLAWSGAPKGTQSFALIVEDPDAPSGIFVHWVLYNVPATLTSLPEGVPQTEQLDSGAYQGTNGFGSVGYRGPCPPPGKPHRYFFILWALDTQLTARSGLTKAQFEQAIQGHILAEARLMGTYSR